MNLLTFASLQSRVVLFILCTLFPCFQPPAHGDNLGQKTITMYAPYAEFSLSNISYPGNAFDLVAKATFTHHASGEQRTTGMFYDGEATWKFRFTGVKTGLWNFITISKNSDFDGHTGSVSVLPNPNAAIEGFLSHQGNQFAIQKGDDAHLEGYSFTVFMNHKLGKGKGWLFHQLGADLKTAEKAWDSYLDNVFANGFEIVHLNVGNSWFNYPAYSSEEHSSTNPDITTFRILETCIQKAHARGGRVHIWAWGDHARKATPINVGGINGRADQRVQRYIAARLGPLPGWTMGYGFDLWEWTTLGQIEAWATYLYDHFGWQHLLSARGWEITSTPATIIAYGSFGADVISTTAHGPRSYNEITNDIRSNTKHPHLYEERHTYKRPEFKLDMEGTRRMLWQQTMAGGMGGFFGFYNSSPHPYPKPEQLRTHYTFWHKKRRFVLGMTTANSLSNGYCLTDREYKRYVFYGEDIYFLHMDLSHMGTDNQPAIAVDLAAEYKEIDLGLLSATRHTWRAPYRSDWAIAVGSFYKKPG